jgi:hypothetical protein
MRLHIVLLIALLAWPAGAVEKGFQSLFNGRNLDGWVLVGGKGPGYVVQDGVLVCPADGGGNLLTDKDYSDFIFRFEFKLTDGANNGVGIRAPLEGDIAYTGMEIQILDHDAMRYQGKLRPAQYHGSIYDVFPAKTGFLKETGEWNQEEISAVGQNIKVVLNGSTIVDANLDSITDPVVLKKHPGLLRTTGRIGFLGHGARVDFRNIRIRPVTPE